MIIIFVTRRLRPKSIKAFEEIFKQDGIYMIDGINNPLKTNGDTTIIYCANKGEIYECLVDTDMLDHFKDKGTWIAHTRKDRDEVYVISSKVRSMHRYIMEPPKGMVVDHINGNSLDNRKSNLRVVTQGTNMLNKSTYKNSVHGINGLIDKKDKYCIRIDRIYYNIDYAKEALEKVYEILNHYSEIDAKERNEINYIKSIEKADKTRRANLIKKRTTRNNKAE